MSIRDTDQEIEHLQGEIHALELILCEALRHLGRGDPKVCEDFAKRFGELGVGIDAGAVPPAGVTGHFRSGAANVLNRFATLLGADPHD